MLRLLSSLLILVTLTNINCVSAVPVQFDLELDHKAEETSFELRGPLPSTDVVDNAPYFSLYGKAIKRDYNLEEGKFYYLMMLDSGKDGIENGNFKLTADYGKKGSMTLKEGHLNSFGHGKVWNFHVPSGPGSKSSAKKEEMKTKTGVRGYL